MREKINHYTLLVGVKIGMASMESNLEIPNQVEKRVTVWPNSLTPGHV